MRSEYSADTLVKNKAADTWLATSPGQQQP